MKILKFPFFLTLFFLLVALYGCKPENVPNGGNSGGSNPPDPPVVKTGFDKNYTFYDNDATLKAKLFYFFLALEKSNAKQLVIDNSSLKTLKTKYDNLFNEFSQAKYPDTKSLGNALLLSSDEILSVQQALEAMAENEEIDKLIKNHIHPSGKYEVHLELNNKYLLRMIWKESVAKGINTILEQYLIGVQPKYYEIDGPKRMTQEEYKELIAEQMEEVKNEPDTGLFYSKLVNFVIRVLEINDRDEAVRFEPLAEGENKKAISNLSSIKWDNFAYSSILLLGDSPNSPGDDENLSTSAKVRIQYAVEAFNAKMAPVIIISGANVYPYQTPYFEAIEMKKWMIDKHQIDEKNIIVEPVARHTTTNLRNGSRLIFKYKIPTDKKGIIVTTKTQNDIIVAESFKQRCINDLGFMPVKLGNRLNDTRLEFMPLVVSMQVNTLDPLDP